MRLFETKSLDTPDTIHYHDCWHYSLSLNASKLLEIFSSETLQQEAILYKPLTVEELTSAIKLMQTGKSPGPDGFPSEFFKKFAPTFSRSAFLL